MPSPSTSPGAYGSPYIGSRSLVITSGVVVAVVVVVDGSAVVVCGEVAVVETVVDCVVGGEVAVEVVIAAVGVVTISGHVSI